MKKFMIVHITTDYFKKKYKKKYLMGKNETQYTNKDTLFTEKF